MTAVKRLTKAGARKLVTVLVGHTWEVFDPLLDSFCVLLGAPEEVRAT